ncbi:hypothetical protein DDJ72_04090 [Mycobacteroides abscessus]|uniref:hypothetical protein n=1 Tax=Mycobacteroides abscessus TaxID=36809 RepID=UPI000D3E8E51|nr:hypothetical protein [Mycobacteroides abscessus]PVA58081.1 hypothetical protein DDJ72_04090 [Mycobacteroides abscessus]
MVKIYDGGLKVGGKPCISLDPDGARQLARVLVNRQAAGKDATASIIFTNRSDIHVEPAQPSGVRLTRGLTQLTLTGSDCKRIVGAFG